MKIKIQNKIIRSELFTLIFFIEVTLMYSFENTYIECPKMLYSTLLYSAIIFALLSILQSKYNRNDLIIIGVVSFLSLLVYLSSHESIYLIMILSGLVMRNVDYRSALKQIFRVRLCFYICIICLSIKGIVPIGRMVVPKGIWGSAVGYSFGYKHPNNFAQIFFMLAVLYICIKKDELKRVNIGILVLLDVVMYILTQSKTSCIIVLCLCVSTWIFLYGKSLRLVIEKVMRITAVPTLLCCILIGVIFPYSYQNLSGKAQTFIYLLNGKMNGRLSNASTLFSTIDLSWFGKIVDLEALTQKYQYSVIDDGYAFALFNFGIVGFTVIVLLYFITIRKLKEKNEYIYLSVVLAFCTLALFENVLRAMFVNFAMIFWNEAFTIAKNKRSLARKCEYNS